MKTGTELALEKAWELKEILADKQLRITEASTRLENELESFLQAYGVYDKNDLQWRDCASS